MTFTTVKLAGQRTLVKGEDNLGNNGQAVLSSAQWDYIKAESTQDHRLAEFNAAVDEFFQPLTDAVDAFNEGVKSDVDPIDTVTIGDEVEHVEGRPARTIELSHDSKVLRLIEEGQHSRLIWVGDNLEITEFVPPKAPTTVEANADLV
jgi:hypothetical protein